MNQPAKESTPPGLRRIAADLFSNIDSLDFLFAAVLILSIFLYHHDLARWAGLTLVGNEQYGDAEFWWNGAVQLAHGILAHNISITYRMGYAIVAGLWIALFGAKFALFHTVLLIQFAVAWYVLYLVLRPSLGRWGAACGVLLMVLNPFTAEWLAISTSDSLGLLFNLWALCFLLVSLEHELNPAGMAGCGFFLAAASLTRPLMTPFFAATVCMALLAPRSSGKRRLRAAAALLIAFLIPVGAWIAVLRPITGNWQLAGSDASIFYAASDPSIQVWTPDMYPAVDASARAHLGLPQVTRGQLDGEFRRLAILNYAKYPGYQLRRMLPHLREIASISIDRAAHVNLELLWLRRALIAVFALGWIALLLTRRALLASAAVALVVAAWIPAQTSWVIVLAACLGAIPAVLWGRSRWGALVFTIYWLTGVGALFLVGGTSGPGSSVNALGYRLGMQFFFASDFIVLFLIRNLSLLDGAPAAATRPLRKWPATAISVPIALCGIATSCLAAAGGGVVAFRAMERSSRAPQPYPDLTPVVSSCEKQLSSGDRPRGLAGRAAQTALGAGQGSPYILTTGSTTNFIWNLDGQERSKLELALQSNIFPFDFEPRIFVDFPQRLEEDAWSRKAGAWLLRRLDDEPPISNLPWYIEDVAIRAFIPLERDGSGYDLARARWFRLPKYASQLYRSKQLSVEAARLEFSPTSGERHYPRRFSLRRDGETPAMVIDASLALGRRDLSFAWEAPARRITVRVQGYDASGRLQLERSVDASVSQVKLDLNSDVQKIRVEFTGLAPQDTVWIYELNLTADDWER